MIIIKAVAINERLAPQTISPRIISSTVKGVAIRASKVF